jgi:hypothetical protein
MPHTHSSYGSRRYFVTYISNTTLLHTGVIILVKPHVRDYDNMSGLFVEKSKSMRFSGITNKSTLKCFRVKLGQMDTLFEIVTLTTKYSEVLDVGLVASEDLVWSLVQAPADV